MTEALALTRAAVSAPAETDALHVVFRVGAAEYALAASQVVQMESFVGATPVPGVPSWVIGLMQVRGRVVPVLDLRARFGVAAVSDADDGDARVIIASSGDRVVGLRVDRAREVLVVPAGAIQPVPPALEHTSAGFIRAIAQVGPRLLFIVNLARILGEEPSNGQ